jgi:hypothetical protein
MTSRHPPFISRSYGSPTTTEGDPMLKPALVLTVIALAVSLPADGVARSGSGGFSAHVTNPWFPLEPGTTYTYVGVKDGKPSRDVILVTRRTITIAGAPCVVVSDRLYLAGHLQERTLDYYSQNASGDVWYFGEDTAELDEKGHVTTTEGTWRAGVDGARPGIFMPAHPRVGQTGQPEFYKGHAQDHFRVVAFLGPNALRTEEWTPLEPGVLDHKLYVRSVGDVFERTVKGGDELNELVRVTRR